MATGVCIGAGYIKIEDTPSPELDFWAVNEPVVNEVTLDPTSNTPPTPVVDSLPTVDPRDPEGFLKRCSGFNKSKKNKERCSAVIGKKSEQSCHPTFLPTCRAHRDQQTFAGWCQYKGPDGTRCGRLFRWTPPYFELCIEHQGHPGTPCYFFNLPLELRHEILQYLLPDRPIGSSTAALHDRRSDVDNAHAGPKRLFNQPNQFHRHTTVFPTDQPSSIFTMPLMDLFLVNRRFYQEAKDLLFSTVPFTIDVRKDGTFMCGRRLLEPRRADGSSHFLVDGADEAKQRFLRYFDWGAVKHYIVDILVENWASGAAQTYANNSSWDEEVELYDIRDYISVVVSGVLAKSHQLNKLSVRLCLSDFSWSHPQILTNTKIIVGPFESLRNVRQPQILGISMGKPNHNAMLTVQRPPSNANRAPICSVPPLPTHSPVLVPGMPDFDAYAKDWTRWVSSSSATALTPKSPIRAMFAAFREFYSEVANLVPDVTYVSGRHAFLHRARVAREQENVEAFRALRNQLIAYWYAYLEQEEVKKRAIERRLGKMLDTDVYPSHEWEDVSRASSKTIASSSTSPMTSNAKPESKKRVASLFNGEGSSACGQQERQSKRGVAITQQPRNTFDILTINAERELDFVPVDVDTVDDGCFAHGNLSSDWYDEPGPSTKKMRVDSGFSEMTVERSPSTAREGEGEDDCAEVVYVGKGKGRMGASEVICID